MQMPVIVGVVIAVILLISFSGWFYHLVEGWNDFVLDDVYFWYRIMGATALSFTIMSLTFFGLAYASECPSENKTALAAHLNCEAYTKLTTNAEEVFKKNKPVEPPAPDMNNWENQTKEI